GAVYFFVRRASPGARVELAGGRSEGRRARSVNRLDLQLPCDSVGGRATRTDRGRARGTGEGCAPRRARGALSRSRRRGEGGGRGARRGARAPPPQEPRALP